MDEIQKQELIKLKNSGRSYKEMASTLSISEGTIKSFFRRQKIKFEEIYTVCKNCGVKLEKVQNQMLKNFVRMYADIDGGERIQKIIENV